VSDFYLTKVMIYVEIISQYQRGIFSTFALQFSLSDSLASFHWEVRSMLQENTRTTTRPLAPRGQDDTLPYDLKGDAVIRERLTEVPVDRRRAPNAREWQGMYRGHRIVVTSSDPASSTLRNGRFYSLVPIRAVRFDKPYPGYLVFCETLASYNARMGQIQAGLRKLAAAKVSFEVCKGRPPYRPLQLKSAKLHGSVLSVRLAEGAEILLEGANTRLLHTDLPQGGSAYAISGMCNGHSVVIRTAL
jgi:hypothetical protein